MIGESGFLFINWIFKIWTCPDFISGRVQIWNFWWKILNLDLSEFQFRTRPDFFFQLKIWNLDLSRYQFWTSDSHVTTIHLFAFVTLLLCCFFFYFLSKPQPNHNTTQLNLTRVGFDMIITLHHHPPPTPQELYFYQK